MKCMKHGIFLAALMLAQSIFACTQDGVEGFLPENDMRISVNAKRFGGISEEKFSSIITRIEDIYAPIVKQEGGDLKVVRLWKDETVNAYAQQMGKEWRVSMFGGLARHDAITEDGFALVVCHELGHHIGGAPRKVGPMASPWASNEGQADYFSTLKCLRRVWLNDDNEKIVSKMAVPAALDAACSKHWLWNSERALCIRNGMAGDSVAKLFAALRKQEPAKFETPDASVVKVTNDNHPAFQCRLDTYLQGSLCEVSFNENVEASSEVTGTCHGSLGHSIGTRPLCWFKPKVQ